MRASGTEEDAVFSICDEVKPLTDQCPEKILGSFIRKTRLVHGGVCGIVIDLGAVAGDHRNMNADLFDEFTDHMKRSSRGDRKTGIITEFPDRIHRQIRDLSARRKKCIIDVADDQPIQEKSTSRKSISAHICRSNSTMI